MLILYNLRISKYRESIRFIPVNWNINRKTAVELPLILENLAGKRDSTENI